MRRAADLSRTLDVERLLGSRVQVLRGPGTPAEFSDVTLASTEAGFDLAFPAMLPVGTTIDSIVVTGPSLVQVTADTTVLRQVMDLLAIDLDVPPGLDGQVVTLQLSSMVAVRYKVGDQGVTWVDMAQARNPEIAMPAGVDLAALGEIALRILGLSPGDAREIARAIDWSTTLLVPIPGTAQSYRQVHVGGGNGLLVETQPSPGFNETMLLWSTNGRAFHMHARGDLSADQLLEMADSVR
jgi:hypothetical protein